MLLVVCYPFMLCIRPRNYEFPGLMGAQTNITETKYLKTRKTIEIGQNELIDDYETLEIEETD